MNRHEFAAALKLLRLTQQEIARLLGVHGARTVRRWLTGERTVPGPVEAALTAWLIRGIPRPTRDGTLFRATLEAVALRQEVELELPEPRRRPAGMSR